MMALHAAVPIHIAVAINGKGNGSASLQSAGHSNRPVKQRRWKG